MTNVLDDPAGPMLAELLAELSEAEPMAAAAAELMAAGLAALLAAELDESVPAALMAADLMDAGVTALVAAELFEAELAAALARDQAGGGCSPGPSPARPTAGSGHPRLTG